MDDTLIVAIYVVIDDTMTALGHHSHCLAGLSDAEVLTIAVLAARVTMATITRGRSATSPAARTSRARSRPRASTGVCTRWPTGWTSSATCWVT